MADKKLERRPLLDPAVADLLSGMEQRQAESALPRKEREKKARERAKIQARRDQRVTYDLPPSIRERIKDISESQRVPASQIVTLALARFLKAYDVGEIDIGQYKHPSRSPRYDWNLLFPEDLLPANRSSKRKGRG
jgi:hypothetical protein